MCLFPLRDALCALMVVLAIDAEKCSRNNHTWQAAHKKYSLILLRAQQDKGVFWFAKQHAGV